MDRLTKRIMPDAWDDARERVQAFQAGKQSRQARKTRPRILTFMTAQGSATSAEVAAGIDIKRNTAVEAMRRMNATGTLAQTPDGKYTVTTDHTRACTHTILSPSRIPTFAISLRHACRRSTPPR